MSKYGVISDPYFPVFGLNTEKYGPEITPYLVAYYAVSAFFYSSLNNPFYFLATINIPLDNFVTSLFTDFVIMFDEYNSIIVLKGVLPDDARSNFTHFETLNE